MLCGVAQRGVRRGIPPLSTIHRWRSRPLSHQISACGRGGPRASPTTPSGSDGWKRGYSSVSRVKEGNHDGFESWAEKKTDEVRVGGAGNVKVDIFNPSLLSNPATPLLIYLPPTGVHLSDEHAPIPPYLLTSHSSLARINYRWNVPLSQTTATTNTPFRTPGNVFVSPLNHPFPTPIHDTLLAYSHLLSRYSTSPIPSPSASNGRNPYIFPPLPEVKQPPRPILIYGSFLGGSLATSLALTESFISKTHPFHISGLISRSGIYDWVTAATENLTSTSHVTSTSSQADDSPWDINTLLALRERLFTSPVGGFDPFASPTLFFRTAGSAIPKAWSDISPTATLPPSSNTRVSTSLSPTSPSPWDDYDPSSPSFLSSTPKSATSELELDPPTKRAHLKFPSKDSGLRIPRTLFLYHHNAAGRPKSRSRGEQGRQAEDMAGLMRRSVVQHEFKERAEWDDELDPKRAAAERVQCMGVVEGKGDGEEGEGRVVREWIEEALG